MAATVPMHVNATLPPTRAATLFLLGSALTACGRPEAPRDVLLVTIDTLRADLVGAYGHPRPATPRIDAIAERGLLFERHYSAVPKTAPSHTTMFTGLWPSEHGLRRNGHVLAPEVPVLAEAFAGAGYTTAAVVGSMVLESRFGLDRGFDLYDDDIPLADGERRGRRTNAERFASDVVDHALAILRSRDDREPLFLWVHVFDPHAPFEAPEAHIQPGSREDFRRRVEPSRLFTPDQLINAYIGYELEVAYTDHHLGRLFDAWDQRSGPAGSIVAITSDHGEGLGEHGFLDHGLYLYEEQLHVPLVVRAAGLLPAGERVSQPTSMVDLAATLTSLAGIDSDLPGTDLRTLLQGGAPRPVVAERPLYGEWDYDRPSRKAALELYPDRGNSRGAQLTVVADDWKLIESSDVQPELYGLRDDPREQQNLGALQGERLQALRDALGTWKSSLRPPADGGELTDEGTLQMLEALGYR